MINKEKTKDLKMEKIVVEIIHEVDGKLVVENVEDVIKREAK